jgi:hypothetical protein
VVEGLGYARVQVAEAPTGFALLGAAVRSAAETVTGWVRRLVRAARSSLGGSTATV